MRRLLLVLVALFALAACATPTTPTTSYPPAPPATPTPPPGVDTFTFDHERFTFDYPSHWTNREDRYPGFVQPNPEFGTEEPASVSGDGLGFFIGLRSLPEGTDLQTLVDDTYDRLVEGDMIEEMLSQGESTVDGLPALERVYKRFWGEPLIQQRDLWAERDGQVYVVSCRTSPSRFDELMPLCDQVIASLILR